MHKTRVIPVLLLGARGLEKGVGFRDRVYVGCPRNAARVFNAHRVDELVLVSQDDAEDMARRLAREEGIFGGISAAGACWVAQQIAAQEQNATIVFVVCDRGDRYLSTGVFPA